MSTTHDTAEQDTYRLDWVSADGQGTIPMGDDYATEQAAREAIPAMQAELIGQCGEAEQADAIHAGRWVVSEVSR